MSQKRLASFFRTSTGNSVKRIKDFERSWEKYDNSVLVGKLGNVEKYLSGVEKYSVAAFDLDGTLITTASGRKFAKDDNDWKLLYRTPIQKAMEKLWQENHIILVISNQLGVTKGQVDESKLKKKIEQVWLELGGENDRPIWFFAATKNDIYRKPIPGMSQVIKTVCGIDIANDNVQLKGKFYCGDAAGRPAGWKAKAKKDFSDSDRKFALNNDMMFYTPEEYFLISEKHPYQLNGVDTNCLDIREDKDLEEVLDKLDCPKNDSGQQQQLKMIINVGYPGSGKSHFSVSHLLSRGYIHINQDKLKTSVKCHNMCELALNEKKCVVIDNTNLDLASRKGYLDLAKKYQAIVTCLHFDTSLDICKHNNVFRELTQDARPRITSMVYNMMKKKYTAPSIEEGFQEIISVPYKLNFAEDDDVDLYAKYLV